MMKEFKRRTATILASLAIASTGAILPAPASARPTCEEEVVRECNQSWYPLYASYEECYEWEITRCPHPDWGWSPPPYARF